MKNEAPLRTRGLGEDLLVLTLLLVADPNAILLG